MQELDKILKEIKGLHGEVGSECTIEDRHAKRAWEYCLKRVEDIVCKHMNDGWIPVGERLPEEKEWSVHGPERCCSYMRRMEIAYMTDTVEYAFGYYDGYKWIDKRHNIIPNVVAWRIHKPYRPERREEE